MDDTINPGEPIFVKDAFGHELRRIATTGIDPGDEFAVIWACREEEWERARAEGREPDATPWPVEDVTRADEPAHV